MAIALSARRQVMAAADKVETTHPREAAILGGIVRSAIDAGYVDLEFVRRYTYDILGEFELVNVDRGMPGPAEIDMVMSRFEKHYGRPLTT